MRRHVLTLALLLAAAPLAAATSADHPTKKGDAPPAPEVRVEQTTRTDARTAPVQRIDARVTSEPAQGKIGDKQWWYITAAIVAAGIILVILL